MAQTDEVSIIVPACNEAAAIGPVVRALLAEATWHEILVVDDGSSDATASEAAAAGARVLRHPYNKGNGAAVKTGLRAASGAYVLIVDGDGQHNAADALRLVSRLGEYDLVIGARAVGSQAGLARRLGNALLNGLATFLTERRIPDLTSGLRACRTEQLREFIHLLPNGFSTPTTSTLAFIKAGYSVAFEPITATARTGTSKIRFFRDGLKFALIALRVITIFSPMRLFLPISAAAFLLGGGYAAWTIATQRHVTNSSELLITLSVLVLLVGLVAEQIAALRFDGRR